MQKRIAAVLFIIFCTIVIIMNVKQSAEDYSYHDKFKSSLPILKIEKEIIFDYANILFNPGLIVDPSNPKEYLMTLRQEININKEIPRDNKIWLAHLDAEFNILTLDKLNITDAKGPQDAVPFVFQGSLYIAYNAIRTDDRRIIKALNRHEIVMHISKLETTNSPDKDIPSIVLPNLEHSSLQQKNWTPFVAHDKMHFVYRFNPHMVVEWDHDKREISEIYTSSHDELAPDIWRFGEIHGGTPAIYVKEHDCYISFFQSHIKMRPFVLDWVERKRRYYIGAYMFDKNPPFKIRATLQLPLSYDGLYDDDDDFPRIIFPRGLVDKGDHFLISAGLDDYRSIILSVNKDELYKEFTFYNQES